MDGFKEQLILWRHTLHAMPETAFKETRTAAFIADALRAMGFDVQTGIGGTGVVASMSVGSGSSVIGLRADMDAICLQEQNTCAYKSRSEGVMHGCGHDGHVAQLLGAAKLLSERKNFNGTVRCIFQPAEEPGRGAQAMLDDDLLTRFPIDELYGLHNMPSLPAGSIQTRVGGIMASEDNFTIKIHGKGGHASSPHLGNDPLVVAAQIILALQNIVSRNANPLHPVVVSCTQLLMDGAHNAIASNVILMGDTRSTTPEDQKLIETRMRDLCEHIGAAYGVAIEMIYTHEFKPTVNWEACTRAAVKAAEAVVGAENSSSDAEPWMASEDFGTFLKQVPGCFLFLGSKRTDVENMPLHNANFDYNDDVLTVGAEFFAELVHERLS